MKITKTIKIIVEINLKNKYMKHFKLIITLFIATALIFSCTVKENKTPKVEKKELSYEKLSEVLGKDIAFKVFDSAGKTEDNPAARGSRKPKNNATVVVWLYDITLTVSATGAIEYTTSPDANWGGCQRFPANMSMDGAYAVWSCQRYWGATQTPPATVICSDGIPAGTSNYRAFTSDHDYQIHISNIVTVNN